MSEVPGHIEQLLKNLSLKKILEILPRELGRAQRQSPSFSEFLERLLIEEYNDKQVRSLEGRIKRAKLPERSWTLESFPFKRQRKVKASVIKELAGLDFISKGENIVFMGETGVGKTGLATALLLKALESGHTGTFIKAQDLFDEMYASLADRSTRSLINRLMKISVLAVDELGYINLRPEQANIFFKLMEERYTHRRPTIITTNLDYEEWYDFLRNKKMVAALLDRIRHRCHTIRIDGKTLRDPQG
jgi:DNA replication protein DnaC